MNLLKYPKTFNSLKYPKNSNYNFKNMTIWMF